MNSEHFSAFWVICILSYTLSKQFAAPSDLYMNAAREDGLSCRHGVKPPPTHSLSHITQSLTQALTLSQSLRSLSHSVTQSLTHSLTGLYE